MQLLDRDLTITQKMMLDPSLSSIEFRVLCLFTILDPQHLARYIDIANAVGISERGVRTTIENLLDKNLISRQTQNKNRAYLYQITDHCIDKYELKLNGS